MEEMNRVDTLAIPVVFQEFNKIPRLKRDIVITEKIDGTNAHILICDDGSFLTASRTRFITPGKSTDNYGFSAWAHQNKEELMKLGPGRHYGEWWGQGIQRGYGLIEKRFSLFNISRWTPETLPKCCSVVPTLYQGPFDTKTIDEVLANLKSHGSYAVPFMNPEGIVVYHTASRSLFKVTLENDEKPKSCA